MSPCYLCKSNRKEEKGVSVKILPQQEECVTQRYFVGSSKITLIQNNEHHHPVGMTASPNWWNAKGGISFQPSGTAQSQPKLFIKPAGLAIILNNHFKPLLKRNNANLCMNVLSVPTGFIIRSMTSLWWFQTEGTETFRGATQTV